MALLGLQAAGRDLSLLGGGGTPPYLLTYNRTNTPKRTLSSSHHRRACLFFLLTFPIIIKYVHSFPSPSPHYPCRHHAFRPIKATPSCTRSPTARATDSTIASLGAVITWYVYVNASSVLDEWMDEKVNG